MASNATLIGHRPSALRTSPIGIVIATFVAIVCICSAFFFASARVVFDLDRHFSGAAFTVLGAWVLVWVVMLFVLPASFLVLAACIDRCPTWWLGALTLFFSILATLAVIAFPALRHFLPIGLITSDTASSSNWYSGALLQLLIALGLLRYFRRPKARSN